MDLHPQNLPPILLAINSDIKYSSIRTYLYHIFIYSLPLIVFRSSSSEVLLKKSDQKICSKFTGDYFVFTYIYANLKNLCMVSVLLFAEYLLYFSFTPTA